MDDCVVDFLSFDFRQLIRGACQPAGRESSSSFLLPRNWFNFCFFFFLNIRGQITLYTLHHFAPCAGGRDAISSSHSSAY